MTQSFTNDLGGEVGFGQSLVFTAVETCFLPVTPAAH